MLRFTTGYVVGDAMTREPISIPSSSAVKDAAKLMKKEKVGSLMVTQNKKYVGIVTDTDIVRKAVTGSVPLGKRKVSSVMSSHLIAIKPDEDIFEAIRMMRDYDIKHLAVEANGEFVGLVTMKDVLKIEPDLFEILVEKIALREAERKPIR